MRTNSLFAGLLAGACIGITFMLGIIGLLGIGMLWQYAFTSSIPVLDSGAWGAVLDDIGRLPSFLLSWVPIVLGLVAMGVLLAFLDRLARRLPQPWQSRMAPMLLQIVIGIVVMTMLLLGADQALYEVSGQGETLPSLSTRQPMVWNLVLIGLPLILGIGGAIWA
ncbi:MAG TPA: hypothetical protein PKA05_07120, partial [Roseiflexaceae bacterium]|nr:hypothetical protein [Roseiflexaceae bacterium]